MSIESFAARRLSISARRIDANPSVTVVPAILKMGVKVGLVIAMIGFFVFSGSTLEPGDTEARLGLASGEGLAPFGQVMGGWDPLLAPGRVLVSQLWRTIDGGPASIAAIRGPDALAAIALGLLVASRIRSLFGTRAGLFSLLTTLGSVAIIDRSAGIGFDLVMGFCVVLTFDRLISKGPDWIAGIGAGATFLMGGWPALAVILLPTILIARRKSSLSARLIIPPLAAIVVWSTWALATTRPEVWASALTLPLMQAPAWSLAPQVLVMALPWSPLAFVACWPAIRSGWTPEQRETLTSWTKIAVIALLSGTLIPGLAPASKVAILVALAMTSAVILDQAWASLMTAGPKRTTLALGLLLGGVGAVALVAIGVFLAVAQPYFRGVGIVMAIVGCLAGLLAVDAVWIRAPKQAVRALIVLAIGVKVAHGSFYAPEINYRFGKGPWGRAIGQHVPPRWPIYVFHPWSPALALATEHPFRQLPTEVILKAQPGGVKFVLLQEAEFTHWPSVAPPLVKVREFQDDRGRGLVLARTPGRLVRRVDRE